MISGGDYALVELQNRNSTFFIERIHEVFQNGLELTNYSVTDKSENRIITDIIQSFKIVKELYMSLYNTTGDNLLENSNNSLILGQENIDTDLRLNAFKFLNFQNNYNRKEITNAYEFFFYRFGRCPGDLDLVKVPQSELTKFIKTFKNFASCVI